MDYNNKEPHRVPLLSAKNRQLFSESWNNTWCFFPPDLSLQSWEYLTVLTLWKHLGGPHRIIIFFCRFILESLSEGITMYLAQTRGVHLDWNQDKDKWLRQTGVCTSMWVCALMQ